MSTPARLAAFATALVAVFALAFGVGRAVGPWEESPAPQPAQEQEQGEEEHGHDQ